MSNLACESGKEIKRIRKEFEKDVLEPLKAALAGISNPPGWRDIMKLLAAAQRYAHLLPRAEGLGRELQEVQDRLLGACVESATPPVEPAPPVETDPEPPPVVEPEPEPTGPVDEIDLSTVRWLDKDVSGWERTSKLLWVEIRKQAITMPHSMQTRWPEAPIYDGKMMVGNPWVFVNLDGLWHAATFEWMKWNQATKELSPHKYGGTLATRIGNHGHIKIKPLKGWVPKAGEVIGIMHSGLVRGGFRNVRKRSNVVKVTWPDFGEPEPTPEPTPPSGEPYKWNLPDHKKVNSAKFIAGITAHGPGARNLTGSPVKKRWNPSHPLVEHGRIRDDNGTLRGSYRSLSGWAPTVASGEDGVWGFLHFVMDGESRMVAGLSRRSNNVGFSLLQIWDSVEEQFGTLPAPGSLCAWWISGAGINERRTDLHPWRR